MFAFELAALAAALCWALTGILSTGPSQYLGAISFNRTRMVLVFVILAVYVALTTGWSSIEGRELPAILLSGFIGIFVGDTALFLALNRLGPRRTAILFSMNAPLSVLLGWLLLHESLSGRALLGIAVTLAGVVLAITFGKRKSQLHQWESVKGPLWVGVTLGLAAALSQSVGSLIARPVMEAGADPVAVSSLRIGVAALGLVALVRLPVQRFRPANPLTLKVGLQVAFSGLLGMGVGMTLILFALSGGEVGIVSTLSATTPALQLPLLWARTREVPALGAWAGAVLVALGSGLIFAG